MKNIENGVRTYPDEREVCAKSPEGQREYKRRTGQAKDRQGGFCALCPAYLTFPTLDHEEGRGMGGAHRDDRMEIDGKWHNAALCIACQGKKGSQRYHWVNGSYVPVGEEGGEK